uniref:hypothetical protein n=1 Tax=Polynucleobacter sp. TaxID=2029855 RepID=UPI0040485265
MKHFLCSDEKLVVAGIPFSDVELAYIMYPIFLETRDGEWPYRSIHSKERLFFPEFRDDLLKIYYRLQPEGSRIIKCDNITNSNESVRKIIAGNSLLFLDIYSKDGNRFVFDNIFSIYQSLVALSFIRANCIGRGFYLTKHRDYFDIMRHFNFFSALDFIYITDLYLQLNSKPTEDGLRDHFCKYLNYAYFKGGQSPSDVCIDKGVKRRIYNYDTHNIFENLFGIEVDIIRDTKEFLHEK